MKKAPKILSLVLFVWLGLCKLFFGLMPYSGDAVLGELRFSHVYVDSVGEILQVLPVSDGLRRVYYDIEHIPQELQNIVINAEDKRFYAHPGVDFGAVARAIFQNTSAQRQVSGASTISMQLARMLEPKTRKLSNKILEAINALQLEARFSKSKLLELYLNLIPFGKNIEGYPAAAQAFFGKSLEELSTSEFYILSIIPRSPEYYDPFSYPSHNLAALKTSLLNDTPLLSIIEDTYDSVLDPSRSNVWPFRCPHYIRYLESQDSYRNDRGLAPLKTTINPKLQSYLEALLRSRVDEARQKRVSNASAYFVEPKTMQVVAWVGSTDFFDNELKGQIDGVTMKRQPGSTLKPFLYALALEHGFTASSILPDIPLDFGGKEVYTPSNFNNQFNGPVRLRQALSSSLNVPAVFMLEKMGVDAFTKRLINLGFNSLKDQEGKLGLGLALGNAEIELKELVEAYGVIWHEGKNIIGGQNKQVIDPRVSLIIRDILTRHPDRTLAFGHSKDNKLPFERAIKTGTSNQFNNIWAVGFTPDLLGGVWMGNFDGQTVVGTADSGYPASIINQTLEAFTRTQTFEPIDSLQKVKICSLSGLAATDACPYSMTEYFIPGTSPKACDWHQIHGGQTETFFPQEYHVWLTKYRYKNNSIASQSQLAILKPLKNSVFFYDPNLPPENQEFMVQAIGSGFGQLRIDNRVYYEGAFPLTVFVPLKIGRHQLSISSESGVLEQDYEVK